MSCTAGMLVAAGILGRPISKSYNPLEENRRRWSSFYRKIMMEDCLIKL